MGYQEDLIENYKSLAEDRGWDDATMAAHIEAAGSRALAEAYTEANAAKSSAPAKRRSKADAEANEG